MNNMEILKSLEIDLMKAIENKNSDLMQSLACQIQEKISNLLGFSSKKDISEREKFLEAVYNLKAKKKEKKLSNTIMVLDDTKESFLNFIIAKEAMNSQDVLVVLLKNKNFKYYKDIKENKLYVTQNNSTIRFVDVEKDLPENKYIGKDIYLQLYKISLAETMGAIALSNMSPKRLITEPVSINYNNENNINLLNGLYQKDINNLLLPFKNIDKDFEENVEKFLYCELLDTKMFYLYYQQFLSNFMYITRNNKIY